MNWISYFKYLIALLEVVVVVVVGIWIGFDIE